MQPIDIVEWVKSTYKNYKTAFPVIDEDLQKQIHTCIEQTNLLWQGPYLSLQRPYGHRQPQRGRSRIAGNDYAPAEYPQWPAGPALGYSRSPPA